MYYTLYIGLYTASYTASYINADSKTIVAIQKTWNHVFGYEYVCIDDGSDIPTYNEYLCWRVYYNWTDALTCPLTRQYMIFFFKCTRSAFPVDKLNCTAELFSTTVVAYDN